MAPRDSQPSYLYDRPGAARLADEWANVGLCGGMFRPVSGSEPAAGEVRPAHPPVLDPPAHGRNQRCCR